MFEKILTRGIWLICLTLSITVSILFFSALSKNPHYKMVVPVMVVTVESLAQLILSRGRAEWKTRQHFRAGIKIGLYAIYIIFFGILSSLSYFVSQMSVIETETAMINRQKAVTEQRQEQNNQLIETLTASLNAEAASGYGRRSEAIMAQIERLKAEQAGLMDKINNSPSPTETLDIFGSMAGVVGIKANTLKLLSFGVLSMFVFAGLIILNPNVTPVTGNTVTPHKKVTPVTRNSNRVTRNNVTPVTPVTMKYDTCPVCGDKFPAQPGKEYCKNSCRVAAYRTRKANIGIT